MKIVVCFFLVLCSSLVIHSQNQEEILLAKKYFYQSDILKIERPYWVHLPKSYNDTVYGEKKYPLLVLLDAEEHFDLATGIVQFMSTRLDSKLLPEFIVLGIPNTGNRIEDYTPTHSLKNPEGNDIKAFQKSGGGPKFIDFIEKELLSKIDENYRTQNFRILVGHSLGGLLTVNSFFSDNSSFNAFLAMDPSLWWDNELLVKMAQSEILNQETNFKTKHLYISGAHNSSSPTDTTAMRKSQKSFVAALEANKQEFHHLKFEIFEEEDHGTIPLISLYQGLQFIFENYKMPGMLGATADEIGAYYKKSTKRIGLDLLPSERVINILGNYYLNDLNEIEKAISFFELNVLNYQGSYHAHLSLASAYEKIGDKANAIKHYEKSKQLKDDNTIAEKALRELLNSKH